MWGCEILWGPHSEDNFYADSWTGESCCHARLREFQEEERQMQGV